MNDEIFDKELLDLAKGRGAPESWWDWWHDHEAKLESLLSPGEFLKLRPRTHGFSRVPVFGNQKGAIAILGRKGVPFETSNPHQERYPEELDFYCKEQERIQREKQKGFKTRHPELFSHYPKLFNALTKILDTSDEIKPAATGEQIRNQEGVLDFTPLSQVRGFFLLTAGIQISTGVIITLSRMFNLIIHEERYYVLSESWKETNGDQLLLHPGEETIWYYIHEQDKIKRFYNDITELLEKELARYPDGN